MNFSRLEINQTTTQIGWEVQSPSYTFEPGHTTISFEHKPAEMTVRSTPPRLTIDQSQCWADMDLKHIFRRIAEDAADGKQAALAYVEKVTIEGEQLGAIENNGNVIRSLAMDNQVTPQHSFAYGNIPGNFSLKYSFTPGELNIDWNTGGTTMDVQSTPFHHNYEKGKISYTVQRKNELHFHSVGGNVNTVY